ncbi:hypothetical protein [Allopontixanthobacter sediminis]|uniref:Uncharacterized protein n=1 Tax=Allopontixanthobacter sediminis TaxID=1689985 RepID=A0A845B5Q5_9SPHN|nr:hypothetical protein [Allopontixanthobacter sediminis]MXP44842.1 hypothetical protein [Allopontixanthobacter sediminis]
MSNFFQKPLFALSDITTAFKRQLGFAKQIMEEDWNNWVNFDRVDEEDIVPCLYCPFEPLHLNVETTSVRRVIENGATWLESRTPFVGDSEFWHFWVGKPDYNMKGEIIRRELVLVESDGDQYDASDHFLERIFAIENILKRQGEFIKEFEASVPSLLQIELLKRKSSQLITLVDY